jgi:predicted phosphohydrolase
MEQMRWFLDQYQPWEDRVPAQFILATPGNHDWWAKLPDGFKTQVFIDEAYAVDGKSFWFTPWVEPIGAWNYQMERSQRAERFDAIPYDLDVLVSHSPMHRVGDKCWDGREVGCPELRRIVQQRRPKHICFGHIHEGVRNGGQYQEFGQTMAHNCAKFGRDWAPVAFDL